MKAAFDTWVAAFPGTDEMPRVHVNSRSKMPYKIPRNLDGKCCSSTHFHEVRTVYTDQAGRTLAKVDFEPLPDNEVCARERAWRHYVRLRDGGTA